MTNHWVDIKNADLVLIMGGNAAEAHPCGFKWVTEAKAHNKAKLIVVDPRFTRSASVADYYAPIRPGTDIVFLGGLINHLLTNDKIHREYVVNYTDLSFIVKEDFAFTNGIYSGYNEDKHSYDKSSWDYELGADGYANITLVTYRRWWSASVARRKNGSCTCGKRSRRPRRRREP
jgi:formate dehydrogenase major subunit